MVPLRVGHLRRLANATESKSVRDLRTTLVQKNAFLTIADLLTFAVALPICS